MFNGILKYSGLIVLILFLLAELIIGPAGEFPLNDDWAYAKAIDTYITTGNIQFSFWQAIPGLSQFFTGVLFSKIFGFSFTLLRIIVVACVAIMIFVFNANLKEFKIDPLTKLIALLLFVFNPLTLSLGNSFLPDIFVLFFAVLSFQVILLFIRTQKNVYLILFIVISLLGTLNRQTGIVIPLTFGFIYFYLSQKNSKQILISILPFVVNCAALFLYEYFAKHYNKLPVNYNLQLNSIIDTIQHPSFGKARATAYYFITSTICLGLFILPLTMSSLKANYQALKSSLIWKCIAGLYFAMIAVKLLYSGNIFPFVGNMFYHLGTGPVIMTGFNTEDVPELSPFVKALWMMLNFAGGTGFLLAMLAIVSNLKKNDGALNSFPGYYFILLLPLYLLPLCVNYANDRYLIYLLPFFILAYILSFEFKLSFLIPLLYFSVAGSHDYLNINKARWAAADHLIKDLKVNPNKIDGGFEFNGWHLAGTKKYIPSHKGRWWWIEGDDYIVSPVKIKNYEIESEYAFSSWISFKFNKIYVWKRTVKNE